MKVTEKGVSLVKRQATPLQMSDEERLWASAAFCTSNSTWLLSAVYFYVTEVFGLRARDEHRSFTLDQLGEDSQGLFVRFLGKATKGRV